MESSVRNSIKSIGYQLLAAYLFAATLLGGAYLYSSHRQWERLAHSYAQASRHSLLLNDLRQTVNSLFPAANDGFSAVAIADSSGELVLGIPNNSALQIADHPLSITIEAPIFSDEASSAIARIATLKFIYSIQSPVLVVLGGAVTLFFVFVALFVRMKRRIEARHAFEIVQRQVEFEQKLTVQIAHDIRSPLSAINMALKGLDGVPPEARLLLQNASKRMNEIANDLLNRHKKSKDHSSSLIPAPRPLATQPILLSDLLAEVFHEKQITFSEHPNIELKLDLKGPKEAQCLVDKKELSRALSNLINNAVESLEKGGVVTLALRSSLKDVAIIVADDGKGIPEDLLSRLGNEVVSYGKEGSQSGSGLGIFHAKAVVEAMGGKFSIQSRIGLGTIVTINLPRADLNQREMV